MAASEPNWLELIQENEDHFCTWFWEDKDSNEVLELLNNSDKRPHDTFICRDKRPHIYGIVVNYKFDFKDPPRKWKFCKIGHTQVDTTTGIGNRMEGVRREIRKIYKSEKAAAVLFVLPINPLAVSGNILEEETKVRCAFGHKVSKEKAEELKFPVTTEWVLTTQAFIDKFKQKIEEMKKKQGYASTASVNDLKFKTDLPPGLQDLSFPTDTMLDKFSKLSLASHNSPKGTSK